MCINFSFNTATLASSLRLFMFDLLLSSFLIGSTLCIWSTQRMWSCWTKTRWQTLTHLYLLVHSLSWPPITNVVLLSSSFRLPTGPLCSSSEESDILKSKKAFAFKVFCQTLLLFQKISHYFHEVLHKITSFFMYLAFVFV